ncbi:hypothetical protein GN316_06680 [Xylophilus sp. Kf1]|nr:hypothetical protein [Xylophilus sp. Kf1]
MPARITNKLPQFVSKVERNAARGMLQGLVLGASEASVLTPIDTSTLLNSQYRDVQIKGDKIVGTVGYTAEYAGVVHDPDVKQKFRRATAKKEFLKLGFERAEPNIRAVIKGSIKT